MLDRGFQVGRAEFWSALARRFALRPGPRSADQVSMLSAVQPVVDVDRILDRARQVQYATAISADGNVVLWTVPGGKRWNLEALWVEANATGNYSYILNIVAAISGPDALRLHAVTAATVPTYLILGQPIVLDSGWKIQFLVSLFVAAGGAPKMVAKVVESDVVDNRQVYLPA